MLSTSSVFPNEITKSRKQMKMDYFFKTLVKLQIIKDFKASMARNWSIHQDGRGWRVSDFLNFQKKKKNLSLQHIECLPYFNLNEFPGEGCGLRTHAHTPESGSAEDLIPSSYPKSHSVTRELLRAPRRSPLPRDWRLWPQSLLTLPHLMFPHNTIQEQLSWSEHAPEHLSDCRAPRS